MSGEGVTESEGEAKILQRINLLKKKSHRHKPKQDYSPQRPNKLGPLPKADYNSELQRRSISEFQALLPADRFLFRDERTDDAGVDGSLELLIDSSYTDLRAQVQIKYSAASHILVILTGML